MLRPTRRLFGLLLASLLLLFIGTNSQAGWLFVLAALVGGAAVGSALLSPLMVRGLEVERSAPEEVLSGEEAPVELIVRNRGGGTKLNVLVRDTFLSPSASFIPALGPHDEVRLPSLRVGARRGVYDGTPVEVSSSAPFGTLQARRTLPAGGRTVVFPRIVPVSWLPEVATALKPLDAASQRAQKGVGHDFLGVREHSPGDSLRHVHWPTTARVGTVMVREFEQEVPRRTGILVDTWADREGSEESVLDTACAVAASAADLAAREQHPMSLAAHQDDHMRSLPDAALEEALTFLAELTTAGRPLPDLLPQALQAIGRIDTLVIAAPTWGPNAGLARALRDIDDADLQVIVVLIEADSYGKADRATPTLSQADVETLSHELGAARAAVYRVRDGEDLALSLQRAVAA